MKKIKWILATLTTLLLLDITTKTVENTYINETPTSYSQPIPKTEPDEYPQFGFDTGNKERDRRLDKCIDEFFASDKPFEQMQSEGCKELDRTY